MDEKAIILVLFIQNCKSIQINMIQVVYRQSVGVPMVTICAPLVADLFLCCYERDFMLSLSENYQPKMTPSPYI